MDETTGNGSNQHVTLVATLDAASDDDSRNSLADDVYSSGSNLGISKFTYVCHDVSRNSLADRLCSGVSNLHHSVDSKSNHYFRLPSLATIVLHLCFFSLAQL